MQISVDLDRSEAAALLRFLRRLLVEHVESTLRDQPETMRELDQASEKLRIALATALGPNGGPQLLRPRDEKGGILRMLPSRRWAVCRPGREPVEITSGELFRVEVDGELRTTRMEYAPGIGYYAVDGYELRGGLRAAIGSGE